MSVFLKSTMAAVAALAFSIGPASAQQRTIEVRVENVRVGQGAVRVALFDAAGWLETAVAAEAAQPVARAVAVRLSAPAGRYGVAVYQDVNGDGELNRGMFGIPSEPTGFSNDAPANFGPPRFADALLEPGAAPIVVRLR